ncbi:MAG: type III pantothenate kinase [Gammaproteobacteria bacterium]|nr:type III pantothenate kinase [Gammaproteobacteria bacterium]MDH5304669.1 type III pantothenate kinase [Gammaproteobacteria bacterium]MDH5323533.1 type III pantothenate kinase [Gammaproteobacteria bacterium]
MKALLLDAGNTRLKWGLLNGNRIGRTGSVTLATIREQGKSVLIRRLPRDVDAVIASNVAGKVFADGLSAIIRSYNTREVRFVRSSAAACGVVNAYRQPGRLGVDRWVAMIGARASCAGACLVVDAGTAVTIDALHADGRHLGGQILPGLMLMADSLSRNTSDLPASRRGAFSNARVLRPFARSTAAAIAQGAVGAVAGAIERALRTLEQQGSKPTLLLTGGDAPLLQKFLAIDAELRPHLVLEGLACLIKR